VALSVHPSVFLCRTGTIDPIAQSLTHPYNQSINCTLRQSPSQSGGRTLKSFCSIQHYSIFYFILFRFVMFYSVLLYSVIHKHGLHSITKLLTHLINRPVISPDGHLFTCSVNHSVSCSLSNSFTDHSLSQSVTDSVISHLP
jgi:hypothetical protein